MKFRHIAGATCSLVALTLTGSAKAYNEDTHHQVTALALEYLDAVAALPAGQGPKNATGQEIIAPADAKKAVTWLRGLNAATSNNFEERQYQWAQLGIAEPSPAGASSAASAANASSKGVAPRLGTKNTNCADAANASNIECRFPGLLGHGAAHFDRLTDTWGGISKMYQAVRQQVEGKIDGKVSTAMGDAGPYLAGAAAACLGLAFVFPPAGLACFAAVASVPVLVEATEESYNYFSGAEDAIAGDILAGCGPQGPTDTWADLEAATGGSELSDLTKADAHIWAGVDGEKCEALRSWLPDLTKLRSFGSPDSQSGVAKMMRVRLRSMYDWCESTQRPLQSKNWLFPNDPGECGPAINQYFSDWKLDIKATDTRVRYDGNGDGVNEEHVLWSDEISGMRNFTSFHHFIDLFSPIGGVRPSFSDPGAIASNIAKGTRWGANDTFDGYSLGAGGRFGRFLLDAHASDAPDADGEILDSSEDFGLTLDYALSGNALRRRRVNCAQSSSTSTDGFGASNCDVTNAKRAYTDASMAQIIYPPSMNAALDGWLMMRTGTIPTQLDATNSLLPFVDASEPWELAPGQTASGFFRVPRDSTRLYGLAMVTHLLGDAAQPHHLAPTTGFGHPEYESLAERYLEGDSLYTVDSGDVCSVTGGTMTPVAFSPGGIGRNTRANFFARVGAGVTAIDQISARMESATCPKTSFSVRRLVLSTALETARRTQGAAPSIEGSLFWEEAYAQARCSSGLSKAVYNYLRRTDPTVKEEKKLAKRATTTRMLDYVDSLVPVAVAGDALALVNAWAVSANGRASCDASGANPVVPARTAVDDSECRSVQFNAYVAAEMSQSEATLRARCDCALGVVGDATCYDQNRIAGEAEQAHRDERIDDRTIAFLRVRGEHYRTTGVDNYPGDSDGDGIPDGADRCPLELPYKRVIGTVLFRPGMSLGAGSSRYGCTYDADGDGVADELDRCAGTPRGQSVDSMGCSATDYERAKGAL